MSTTGVNMANDQNCTALETTEDVPIAMGASIGHVKIDEFLKLKDSTRKLLYVLEQLQSKTHSKAIVTDDLPRLTEALKPLEVLLETSTETLKPRSISDVIGANAIKMLEYQAKALDCIIIEEEDDCTVYQKLTRKCHCLTRAEYNDFVIHFNEDTKFCTGAIGEIIKNMRIVKKFLYMDGGYTKNALLFLNEGLSSDNRNEKGNILQSISFADLCCVFDEQTIVSFCISRLCKSEVNSASVIQDLASSFLCKLVQTEEGRRYINLNSRITWDIKRVLRKNSTKLDVTVVEALKSILDACQIAATPTTITYQSCSAREEMGNRVLNSLSAFRQYMSLAEVFACLEEILDTSKTPKGKEQLTSQLPTMLNLFKSMLLEYDDSGMNILISNIMNHVMDRSIDKEPELSEAAKPTSMVNTATEPVIMRHAVVQLVDKKKSLKKGNRDKNASKPSLTRQNVKGDRPRTGYEKDLKPNNDSRSLNRSMRLLKGDRPRTGYEKDLKPNNDSRSLNRSMRLLKGTLPSVIVVPIDEGM